MPSSLIKLVFTLNKDSIKLLMLIYDLRKRKLPKQQMLADVSKHYKKISFNMI
jgi:hypothetical protein